MILPFDVRYLPLLVLGLVAITYVPVRIRVAKWSGWHRLAGIYPDRNRARGPAFRVRPVLMGKTTYKAGVRLSTDDSHLHFAMAALVWPGHRPFSIPWSDLTASRDEWPWFPFKGHPMVRLTLARDRDLRILVPLRDGERLVAASGGRLPSDLLKEVVRAE